MIIKEESGTSLEYSTTAIQIVGISVVLSLQVCMFIALYCLFFNQWLSWTSIF